MVISSQDEDACITALIGDFVSHGLVLRIGVFGAFGRATLSPFVGKYPRVSLPTKILMQKKIRAFMTRIKQKEG
jgi:hypothetical protein